MIIAGAWMGMLLSLVFTPLVIVVRSDAMVIGMFISLGLWMTCGYIRIRSRRLVEQALAGKGGKKWELYT